MNKQKVMQKFGQFFCLLAVVWVGLLVGNATLSPQTQAAMSPMAAPDCAESPTNVKIQKSAGGNNFVVSWEAPSVCLNEFEVTLTVTKLSGAERTDKKTVKGRIFVAPISFAGDGDLNPIKSARATVRATGVLEAETSRSIELGFSAGTGNVGGATTPLPTTTFQLAGEVKNKLTGEPINGATISFGFANAKLNRIPSVETDAQGRWKQSGFPTGSKVRVTAFKRFFVINPDSQIVSEGDFVKFGAQPADQNPSPAQTFSVSGKASLENPTQGTQSPLAGATISFSVVNANGNKPNIPGAVTTNGNGLFTQTGFTVGVLYQARIEKSGVLFANATANFVGSTAGQTVSDIGFIGNSKTPPPPPSGTFSANGDTVKKANGAISPLAGVTVSFQVANANNIAQPNVPAAVISGANGKWTQSGFTAGVRYRAIPSKAGFIFPNGTPTFQGNVNGQVVQVEAMTGGQGN